MPAKRPSPRPRTPRTRLRFPPGPIALDWEDVGLPAKLCHWRQLPEKVTICDAEELSFLIDDWRFLPANWTAPEEALKAVREGRFEEAHDLLQTQIRQAPMPGAIFYAGMEPYPEDFLFEAAYGPTSNEWRWIGLARSGVLDNWRVAQECLLRLAVQHGLDAKPLLLAGRLMRELVSSNASLRGHQRPWPACLGRHLQELPDSHRAVIDQAEDLLASLLLKVRPYDRTGPASLAPACEAQEPQEAAPRETSPAGIPTILAQQPAAPEPTNGDPAPAPTDELASATAENQRPRTLSERLLSEPDRRVALKELASLIGNSERNLLRLRHRLPGSAGRGICPKLEETVPKKLRSEGADVRLHQAVKALRAAGFIT